MFKKFRSFDNRLELLVGRLFFARTQVQVHRIGDVHMILDHRAADAGSIRGCVSEDMYRRLLGRVELPRALSVVDVGSNVGGFPFLLAGLGHTFNALTCVEMNPATAERLRFNIRTNWPDAMVINAAVASEPGEVQVRLGRGSTGDSLERGSKVGAVSEVPVRLMRLDEISGDATIDLLKIDVEGAEQDVLFNPGHEHTLERAACLVIEIHHAPTAQKVHDVIESHGLVHVAGDDALIGQHIFERRT